MIICHISADSEEEEMVFVAYPHFSAVESLHDCRTVQYSKLRDLDRLEPCVDLASYYGES